MKTKILAMAGLMAIVPFVSCDNNLVAYEQNDLKIFVEKGDNWMHDFPLFWGIEIKNSPQIAIWVEDLEGNYLSTIYVTRKIATQSWTASGGNRRKEALPAWSYSRGVQYDDGLYLPTKNEPLTDGVSGATPKGSFDVKLRPMGEHKRFIIKVELNHSTDWNESYPENAKEGTSGYSGGEEGSGQPAVVYSVEIDLNSPEKTYVALLIGHSSPDGTDGNIYPDTSSLTSALSIVKGIM